MKLSKKLFINKHSDLGVNKPYFENFDSLRAIAFLGVFFYHSFHTDYDYIKSDIVYNTVTFFFRNSDIGVNLFFVLSGFLITYLLLQEEQFYGNYNLKNFYMRRILRIWPLYYFCVLFGFFAFPVIKGLFGQTTDETASIWYFLVFLSNFNNIINGLPDASVLGVLWSISVEEQFYLFWPLLIFFPRTRLLVFISCLMITVLFRYYTYESPYLLRFHTLGSLSDLSFGGLFAFYGFKSMKFRERIGSIPTFIQLLFLFSFLLIIIYKQEVFIGQILVSIERIITGFLLSLIIANQAFTKGNFINFGRFKLLKEFGKYTYGLYCLHFIGILTATTISKQTGINKSLLGVIFFDTITALLITVALAWISYHYFEKSFLRQKKNYNR